MAEDSLALENSRIQLSPVELSPNAQYIPANELVKRAQADFSKQIDMGLFSQQEIDNFVQEKVIGVKLNGVNVISIDFEHSNEEVDPILEAYIKSPNTRVIVAEYFYPEIKNNAERTGLLSIMNNIGGNYTAGIEYAKKLSEICRTANKPVAVTDLANKARYIPFREFFRNSPLFLELVWGISGVQPELFQSLNLPITGANVAWVSGMILGLSTGKGIFDKEKVGSLEKFVLDFEQARRLYAASGIKQLTQEYPPLNQPGKHEPQIVVVYPKAHGIRITDNLINPNRGLDKAKDVVYKLFGPGLDFSVRQWAWKDSLQRLVDSGYRWGQSGNQSIDQRPAAKTTTLANWMLFSERKIPI